MRKGAALALIAAVVSGVSVFINGIAVKLADPIAYTLLKNLGAFAFIAALVLALGEVRYFRNLNRKQWLTLAIIGIIGGSVPFAMFFYGLSLGGAAVSSFIFRSLFVFAGVFGYLILKEKPEPQDVAAGFAILIGNALLVSGDMIVGTGQLLVFGATILWALEYTVSRKALADIHPRALMASRLLFGSAILLGYLGISGSLASLSSLSYETLQWLLLTSLALGAFMAAWYASLKYLPVLKAAAILAFGGIITWLLELFFHGKALSPAEMAGFFMIALGAAIAARIIDAASATARSLRFIRS